MGDRLPFGPLADLAEARWRPSSADSARSAGPTAHIHQMLGGRWNRTVISRWESGGLTRHVADRVACEAGLHPANIWPEWFDDLEAS